jgi:hypothetical protein
MLLRYNKLSRYNNQALQEHKMKKKLIRVFICRLIKGRKNRYPWLLTCFIYLYTHQTIFFCILEVFFIKYSSYHFNERLTVVGRNKVSRFTMWLSMRSISCHIPQAKEQILLYKFPAQASLMVDPAASPCAPNDRYSYLMVEF